MRSLQHFALPEDIRTQDYLLATYFIRLRADQDVVARTIGFAVGQTIGTWIEVPGISREMRADHQGRVVRILPVPPADLVSDAPQQPPAAYYVQIALPAVNFADQFPMLLNTILGNDASTSIQAKLVDLELPDSMADAYGGPRYGVQGVRDMLGVPDRPLVLNMIKPCTGLKPTDGARILYETALGGLDLIKDDELMGNPAFSPLSERVRAYVAAAKSAAQETGREVVYLPNISDRPDRLVDNARRAVDAGARAVMLTYATVGYAGVQAVRDAVSVPILGHFAGTGMYYEHAFTGMSADLACGLLPRLAGCDMVLTNTPFGGYPLSGLSYLRTVQQIVLPRPGIAAALPVVGGGVHQGTVQRYVQDLGMDVVLGAGGAIQGHPSGATAGARSMMQAVEAAAHGIDLREAARQYPELAEAIDRFGVLA
ncbi:MAG TPA: RuBisCO large subunit C-terminal-like domain-containing protein [Actinomycetota bacterium]|jgi:2,3-diketo-5-methylthiopentyl-1-phosphate enolase|nr:RuBisCO large subunit C-terminal-like domain-containing protein [Actinomycetota bacterium]